MLYSVLERSSEILRYTVSIIVAFLIASIIIYMSGRDPIAGLITILLTPFSNVDVFSLYLQKFTTILMMSLAFSIAMKAYRFNVGIEGQFLLGAIGAAIVGIYINFSSPASFIFPLLAGMLLGLAYASLPALLLYLYGINEIVTTLLMNFISFYLVDLVATSSLRDTAAGHPMTIPIVPSNMLPSITQQPRITPAPIMAIMLAAIFYIFMYRTVYGFEIRAAGSNKRASKIYGIDVSKWEAISLMLGGMVAGLAGALEVTGLHARLISGMQSNYILVAILSSLLAKGHPLYLIVSSLGISIIEVGTSALQRTAGIPSELGLIVEGVLLLSVLALEIPWHKVTTVKVRGGQHG